MNGISLLPATLVDFFGSGLAIVFAVMALNYAHRLSSLEPDNFIWGFLYYFTIAMTAFAFSRGVGHMVRIVLTFTGNGSAWRTLSPFSGGFNTTLMISVAAVTIYYHKGFAAYKVISTEASKLAAAARELQRLNTDLESIVEERTEDLSTSEKKFRNFFENSKDIVYFCDIDGTITDINSSGLEMLGYGEHPASLNLFDLFARPEQLHNYRRAVEETGSISDFEIECIGKDGSLHHLLISANSIFDQSGKVIGHEGIGKDMTRLHTMTQQLINQEKMASVGQMAAGVAHEINTPLGIILGYSQLMMDDFPKESETYNNLQVVERQTKSCRKIVADLLKFSRQAGSDTAPLNLNDIIEEVLAVTEHTLNINGIEVIRRFAPQLPQVRGDAEKLRQVFINLINNAQHAMVDGGTIVIETVQQGAHLTARVIDSGTGISDDIKQKIFDPFFTTKKVGDGTGLGLSVTYGILQEHGGSIRVESPVADGKGSAFHLTLPVISTESSEKHEEKS
jgi:PAS domain S-box-containing protein